MTRELDKGLQRLRVGQRIPTHRLVWIDTGKNPLYRYLTLLAIEGVRDCVDAEEPIRHMPRRQFGAQRPPQPRLNITEFGVAGEYDEAEQLTFIAGTEFCSVHDQRIVDLLEPLDHRVELGRPHPHSPAVEGRVAASIDDKRPARCLAHPVAMPPHAGEIFEVGSAEPGAVWVVPERHWHRGHWLRQHQLANLVNNFGTAGDVRCDGRTEGGTRQFPQPD